MSATSTQFEFRFLGAAAPSGELDADHLIAVVQGLRDVASKVGRVETHAEVTGRAPARVHRVARLPIGLAAGSTCLQFRRSAGDGALFDLDDERAFDESVEALVESIAADRRPDWVGDSLAVATGTLTGALKLVAPQVEFRVDGRTRRSFETAHARRETWAVAGLTGSESVTFVGRLYALNLKTRHFQVQDDVGHQVALPKVTTDDETIGLLVNKHVVVTGLPETDAQGRLSHIHGATVEAAPDPLGRTHVPAAVPLADILATAAGIEPGGIELTDEEFDSFMDAMGL